MTNAANRSPIVMLAMLALSHLATIALFLAARILLQFDGVNFFGNLVIPIGALMFGMLGSLGALVGAGSALFAPDRALRNTMVLAAPVSLLGYLLIIAALTDWSGGGSVGVLGTIASQVTDAEYVMRRGSESDSLGQVGAWGLLLLALKLAGAAGGAFVAYEGKLYRSGIDRTFE